MKNKCFAGFVAILFAVALLVTAPAAFAVSWTDWPESIVSGSGSGVITLGSDTVNVGFSGPVSGFSNDGYWYHPNGPTPQMIATYGNLNPSEMIQEMYTGRVTLTFSKPVVDLYIALVSVGQPNYNVSYAFQNLQNSIEVYSYGFHDSFGFNGPIAYGINGNTFTGAEFSGILKLAGTYTSLTFDIGPNETWHGFNIGAASVSNEVPAVPEPATMLLLGLGLMGIAGMRKKFKKQS